MKDVWTVIGAIVAVAVVLVGVGVAWDKLDNRISALEDWDGALQARVKALEAQTQTQAQAQAPDPLAALVERCLDLAYDARITSDPERSAAIRSIMANLGCGGLKK